MRIKINYKKNIAKNMEAKQYVNIIMDHWGNQEEIKKYLGDKTKMETQGSKTCDS